MPFDDLGAIEAHGQTEMAQRKGPKPSAVVIALFFLEIAYWCSPNVTHRDGRARVALAKAEGGGRWTRNPVGLCVVALATVANPDPDATGDMKRRKKAIGRRKC